MIIVAPKKKKAECFRHPALFLYFKLLIDFDLGRLFSFSLDCATFARRVVCMKKFMALVRKRLAKELLI